MATKKLQVMATLGPTDSKIKSAVEEYYNEHPVDPVLIDYSVMDKLCAPFTETGSIVTCKPVEGYPLTVQTNGATKVYRSGKNLLTVTPKTFTSHGLTFTIREDGTTVIDGTVINGNCYEGISDKVPIMEGVTYTLSGCTDASSSNYNMYLVASGAIGLYHVNNPATGVATGSGMADARIVIYDGVTVSNLVIKPQLEIGSSATDFETGVCEEFTPGESIPALSGVNNIWADSGDVTVSGAADPKVLFDKLTNTNIEEWTFELEDGSTVTKQVVVK